MRTFDTRGGELVVLAALTVLFALIGLALVLMHAESGPVATAMIAGLTALIGGVLVLVRGEAGPGDPGPKM